MGNVFNAMQKSRRDQRLQAETPASEPALTPATVDEHIEAPSEVALRAPSLMMVEEPSSAAAEQFRIARNLIRSAEREGRIGSILVTAINPQTETHRVAANLAATFAAEPNGNVLLVDIRFRKAGVTEIFGAMESPGLLDLLGTDDSDGLTVDEALKYCLPTSVGGLTLLPSGGRADLPSDVYIRSRLTRIPGLMRDRFGAVVMEAPPILEVMDVAVFAALTDAVILVVEAGRTSRDDVIRSVELIQGSGANLVGCIVSGAVETFPKWLRRILMIGPR